MTTTKLLYLILTTLLITSCSTINRSLSLGTASGVAIGLSLAPLKQPHNSKNAVKFGVIGALIGGVSSYFIHKSLIKRDENVRKETLFNLEKFGVFGLQDEQAPLEIPYKKKGSSQ